MSRVRPFLMLALAVSHPSLAVAQSPPAEQNQQKQCYTKGDEACENLIYAYVSTDKKNLHR